jgi:hypothetical protein
MQRVSGNAARMGRVVGCIGGHASGSLLEKQVPHRAFGPVRNDNV